MTEVSGQLLASPLSPPLPKRAGDRIQWRNLKGSSASLAIAEAVYKTASDTLILVENLAQAERLEQDIQFFLKGRSDIPSIFHFADWETLPYDSFSPHQSIISERMRGLYQLALGEKCVVIAAASTLMHKLAPPDYVLGNSLVLDKGAKFNFQRFGEQLVAAGYTKVDTVYQHGEFAVRGSLMDVFPMGSDNAFRIELFDDEVETLRAFDAETQRTVEHVDSVEILPAKECPIDDKSVAQFKNRWHEQFDVDHRACSIYLDVADKISPAGIEYFLPLFFEKTATLFDYLPADSTTIVVGDLETAVNHFWQEANNRYESRKGDLQRPILAPQLMFTPVNTMFAELKGFSRITLSDGLQEEKQGNHNFGTQPPANFPIDAKAKQPLHLLDDYLCSSPNRVLFCAESQGRKEILLEQLKQIGVLPDPVDSFADFCLAKTIKFGVIVASLELGLNLEAENLILIAESQLYGQRVQQSRRRKTSNDQQQDLIIKNLTELKVGAPVVHIDHGVGRYKGLQSLEVDNQTEEFLLLEYAENAKIYVPVANLHVISRYSGADEDHAPLHRLGSEQWSTAKRKAAEKIRDVAAELLEIYAQREARAGTVFDCPTEAYQQFSAGFPFEETPDQQDAIAAVRADMLSTQPMDRLVCGDVGFGKTEVAMRAAFIAVQNDKQVVVLVPTTLLAQQHAENFQDRFAEWPINVAVLSRFKTGKETQEIQQKVENGQIDILIGTHKLLQKNMKYPRLGLLIIDEEHRFGVRQKETIKALRSEVDILTMTATPIPRTLNMAMNGIRDLSIIATPPAKRLSIKTFVRESDPNLIKEAVLREVLRGGQVYFLHNEVQTIQKTARDLAELIPEARIQIGHGQMRERELEAVMSDFYHKRFNVLVCTTIVETGIDVPSANTIIIERADKFGLAQLHQLRGRVGRSHHQAYAYLLTPPPKTMTSDAQKRLEAISEAQDLGAGFTLASHDLEIRGAGELLGDEQSGQMQAIGFSLYMDMLDRAVEAIKKGKEIDLEKPVQSNTEVNLRIPALIPEDYLPDVQSRLILYKRLSSVQSEDELDELKVEMIDRFGPLPDPINNLIRLARIKLSAEPLGIIKIEANKQSGVIEFGENINVDTMTIIKLIQSKPDRYRPDGETKLKFFTKMEGVEQRINEVQRLLATLKN